MRPNRDARNGAATGGGWNTVLLPNPFYRTSRSPVFPFKADFGDDRTMKRFGELATPLTPEAIERDASAYVDFLSAQKTVSSAKIGLVGHCFTGMVALRFAAARPDRIRSHCVISRRPPISRYNARSPHLVLPRVPKNGPSLYFAHATR